MFYDDSLDLFDYNEACGGEVVGKTALNSRLKEASKKWE